MYHSTQVPERHLKNGEIYGHRLPYPPRSYIAIRGDSRLSTIRISARVSHDANQELLADDSCNVNVFGRFLQIVGCFECNHGTAIEKRHLNVATTCCSRNSNEHSARP